MKTALLLLNMVACLLVYSVSWAEPPESAADYVFLALSPRNKCYAVQQVPKMNRLKKDGCLRRDARFQMFDTESGKLLWETNKPIAKRGELFISDDAEMMVIVKFHILLSYVQDVTYKDLPADEQKRIAATEVITFMKKDKVLKSYSLEDLGFDMKHLYSGANLSYGCDTHNDMRRIAAEAGNAKTIGRNPYFTDHQVILAMADGKGRHFDFRTGALLKTEKIPSPKQKEQPSIRPDPFASHAGQQKMEETKPDPHSLTPYGLTVAELATLVETYRAMAAWQTDPNKDTPPLYGLSQDGLKILQAYQMDLIRAKGKKGPPLPMMLSPKMDEQLVKEGVLPSRSERSNAPPKDSGE